MGVKIGKLEIAVIAAFLVFMFFFPVTAGRLFAWFVLAFVIYKVVKWLLSRKRKH